MTHHKGGGRKTALVKESGSLPISARATVAPPSRRLSSGRPARHADTGKDAGATYVKPLPKSKHHLPDESMEKNRARKKSDFLSGPYSPCRQFPV
jgi:hypothetical protein